MPRKTIIITILFLGIITFLYTKFRMDVLVINSVMNTASKHLVWVVEQEMPPIVQKTKESPDINKLGQLLLTFSTNLRLNDLRSLIGNELPSFMAFQYVQVGNDSPIPLSDYPTDSSPPSSYNQDSELANKQPPADGGKDKITPVPTKGKPRVFIYSTHNRESFLTIPELADAKGPDDAYDAVKNITLVDQRISDELEQRGIKTIVTNKDYWKMASYVQLYKESLKTVEEVMATNQGLDYILDIHRDDGPREKSTAMIDGESYAKLWIIIGAQNPNAAKNIEKAKQLKEAINKKYPGLCKGILAKPDGNGEYNQHVSPNSLLIEIGGIENTLDEEYRSAAALADVIAGLLTDSQPVDAKPNP